MKVKIVDAGDPLLTKVYFDGVLQERLQSIEFKTSIDDLVCKLVAIYIPDNVELEGDVPVYCLGNDMPYKPKPYPYDQTR